MPRGKKKVEDAVKAVEEKAVATEVEVKKATRAAGRKAKTKVEEAAAKATSKVAEKVDDAATAAEIEAGKAKAKRGRKAAEAKEALVEAASKPARKVRAAKLDIVIQSKMGGAITPDGIAAKVPKDAVSAYVKVEENKIYWVNKAGETGDVEIWN